MKTGTFPIKYGVQRDGKTEENVRDVQYTFENFVGVFDGAYTKEFCETLVQHYENMVALGYGKTRKASEGAQKVAKDDTQIFPGDAVEYIPLQQYQEEFNILFWEFFYKAYAEEYSALENSGHHSNFSFKLQKTQPGGGYHVWHYESSSREHSHRLLTWILYLNDIEDGGETEFLYQHMRVKPKQGTLVIWPAAFTHTHRGNPPLKDNKYIVTGWTEF